MLVQPPAEPPESPRVRELSQRLRQTIHEFQRQYPMTPAELRRAVQRAARTSGPVPNLKWSVKANILFWLAVIALPLVIYWIRRALG